MPRFLCTGDLHLGAGADLGRDPGERLAEQEAVWLGLVKTANELEATILFAGDAWERRRPTPSELLAFRRPLHWLKCPAVIIPGNHDVEGFDRPTGYDVFLIDGGRAQLVPKPKVVHAGGALIACLPWTPPGNLVALEDGGDRDELNLRLADALIEIARGLYVEAQEVAPIGAEVSPIILLGHWHANAATTIFGKGASEIFREPLLDYGALEAIGFDAIALGHNHFPQMLGERGFHSGSPMPLNFGEARYDHVAWLLDVEPGSFQAFQIPVASRPLVNLDVAVSKEGGWPAVDPDLVAGAIVKARLRMTREQARRVDLLSLKAEILEAGAHKVWNVVPDVEAEDIVRGVVLDETMDDVEAFAKWLEVSGVPFDSDVWGDLLDEHKAYVEAAAA